MAPNRRPPTITCTTTIGFLRPASPKDRRSLALAAVSGQDVRMPAKF